MTKNTVAKGISKAIPVVGGVISGGLNFASMLPMAKSLAESLDKANFDYTEAEVLSDYEEVQNMGNSNISDENTRKVSVKDRATNGIRNLGEGLTGIFAKEKKSDVESDQDNDVFSKIEKLAKLKEMGAITAEEYNQKKAELLAQI